MDIDGVKHNCSKNFDSKATSGVIMNLNNWEFSLYPPVFQLAIGVQHQKEYVREKWA
jgi:hypothetical protein